MESIAGLSVMSFGHGRRYSWDRWQQLAGLGGHEGGEGGRGGDGRESGLPLFTSRGPASTVPGMTINFRHFLNSASAH